MYVWLKSSYIIIIFEQIKPNNAEFWLCEEPHWEALTMMKDNIKLASYYTVCSPTYSR